ncbi:MAG: hypothetical protein ACREJN_11490 [Nitrospiraceae bacterium]
MADALDRRNAALVANNLKNAGTTDEEKKIEYKRIAGKIPTPSDFSTAASRKALYNMNSRNASKDDTAADMAEKLRKASPYKYHKGGTVKKSGMALVKKGEKKMPAMKKGPRKTA